MVCFHLLVLPLGPSVPSEDSGEHQEAEHDHRPQEPVHQGELPEEEYVATDF